MDNIAILELYEFELKGYPKTDIPINVKPIRNSKENECGIINFNENPYNKEYRSTCDVITSDDKYIEPNSDIHYNAYTKYQAKNPEFKKYDELKNLYNKDRLIEILNKNKEISEKYLNNNSPPETSIEIDNDLKNN